MLRSNNFLKDFVIGSSYLVFLHFFLSVQNLKSEVMNYTFNQYSLIAPLYLGLMNAIGGILFSGNEYRYLYSGLLSGSIVAIYATISKSYNYSKEEWIKYIIYIIGKHLFTYFVIIQTISNYI
tara:strand:+ start:2170 stop:2538 length:369 start_codon:yes stop_codon:yes gene_type:complete